MVLRTKASRTLAEWRSGLIVERGEMPIQMYFFSLSLVGNPASFTVTFSIVRVHLITAKVSKSFTASLRRITLQGFKTARERTHV